MPTYRVTVVNTVSAYVDVEADTPEAAAEVVFDSDDMPGGITVGAFGVNDVDDGEWEVESVLNVRTGEWLHPS